MCLRRAKAALVHVQVVISGRRGSPEAEALITAAHSVPAPDKVALTPPPAKSSSKQAQMCCWLRSAASLGCSLSSRVSTSDVCAVLTLNSDRPGSFHQHCNIIGLIHCR